MKALIVVTGRGLGGDAVIALNIIKSLEKHGLDCEIALDSSAPGVLFEKNGYSWHKVSIPQAGGHAATKLTTIKAAFKMLKATFPIRKLVKNIKADIVVGIIGGGAIVGCVGAKLSRTPAVGIINTPLDTKICTKLNHCIVLPEVELFKSKNLPANVDRSYYPVNPSISIGDPNKALNLIKKHCSKHNLEFDENKKTILFSSGSSLFELMVKAVAKFADDHDDYNIILIGIPLEEDYNKLIEGKDIINLKYIDWINDLYSFIDLAVLTDDGLMIQEAITCHLPAISLTRVKYGRYHNMEAIFKGAILESDFDQLNSKVQELVDNLDEYKKKSELYSKEILNSCDKIGNIVVGEINK
ncbi:glycosyltransferase [Methanobrevibacter sp. OttesenSCG-928-I08]|nr:glycosyltransferase [Methanobrevibacter sp. OttesenSCG-928-I08]